MLTNVLQTRNRTWTSREAFRQCEAITRDHYENFPVGSLLIPRDRRKYICAIYAFARIADDFADEPGLSDAERIESLNSWEQQLDDCQHGHTEHPVFVALAETIDRFELPGKLFQDLLHAFRQDVSNCRYETFDDLLAYCRCSANPVGRLVLLLSNYRSETLMMLSDHICTALQLTNFWQDVRIDTARGRFYIPYADMRTFSCTEAVLKAGKATPEFQRLLRYEVDRTRQLFNRGRPLLSSVGNDLSFELKLTLNGGTRILQRIEQAGYDVFERRPVLTFSDKLHLVLSSFLS